MKVITIDREFGAGGHSVGVEVAERLGVELYDRAIIQAAAVAAGMDPSELEAQEESRSLGDTILSAIVPNSYDIKNVVFEHEREVVLEFARRGPCVIIGRCASAILAEAGIETIDVFLYAAPEKRLPNVKKLLQISDDSEAMSAMKKRDHDRRSYFDHFTGCRWAEGTGYDLFMNTGTLGYDFCIDAIVVAARLE